MLHELGFLFTYILRKGFDKSKIIGENFIPIFGVKQSQLDFSEKVL